MGAIQLQQVVKEFGAVRIIKGVDLDIGEGEFVVFVGPSGCGKSTLLRLISGLEDVTGGKIVIDGKDATNLGPAQRGLAMVFQSYALYPHMSVRDNIAFPLKMAKASQDVIDAKVKYAARTLNLNDYLDRRPGQLSGGQRQRVAIGRAIVREPKAFLFDEPLSNLDAALRVQMRVEIGELHEKLKTTMVYVTHDQVEAMTMADKIVVLDAGAIAQVGAPLELYNRPANLFVAKFIGSPTMNMVTGAGGGAARRRDHRHPPRAHRHLHHGGRMAGHGAAGRASGFGNLRLCRRRRHRPVHDPRGRRSAAACGRPRVPDAARAAHPQVRRRPASAIAG